MLLPSSDPPVVCSVETAEAGPALRFRGRIKSEKGLAGSYRLVVTKTGPSGAATVRQGGPFSAAASVAIFVGSATVGVEQGARYEARLTVETEGRVQPCLSSTGERT